MGPNQVLPLRVRVKLGGITIKGCSTFSRAPGLEPRHQMQLSIIFRTLAGLRRSNSSAEIQSSYSTFPHHSQPTGLYLKGWVFLSSLEVKLDGLIKHFYYMSNSWQERYFKNSEYICNNTAVGINTIKSREIDFHKDNETEINICNCWYQKGSREK